MQINHFTCHGNTPFKSFFVCVLTIEDVAAPCVLLFSFSLLPFSQYVRHCTTEITLQPLAEVRESSALSSLAPGSLKDIDSSDLHVTALLPTEVHQAPLACFNAQLISQGSVHKAISAEAKH